MQKLTIVNESQRLDLSKRFEIQSLLTSLLSNVFKNEFDLELVSTEDNNVQIMIKEKLMATKTLEEM